MGSSMYNEEPISAAKRRGAYGLLYQLIVVSAQTLSNGHMYVKRGEGFFARDHWKGSRSRLYTNQQHCEYVSAGPQFFWLLLTGQTIASINQLLIWGAPSYMSSIWFPPSQRGIAAAAGGALAPQVYRPPRIVTLFHTELYVLLVSVLLWCGCSLV